MTKKEEIKFEEMKEHIENCCTLLKDYFLQERLEKFEAIYMLGHLFTSLLCVSADRESAKKILKGTTELCMEKYDQKGH